MRNLFVKKLFIYPRFHVEIESELSQNRPELIEVHVMLSEYSAKIQMALFDIINVLLQEFKECCSYVIRIEKIEVEFKFDIKKFIFRLIVTF